MQKLFSLLICLSILTPALPADAVPPFLEAKIQKARIRSLLTKLDKSNNALSVWNAAGSPTALSTGFFQDNRLLRIATDINKLGRLMAKPSTIEGYKHASKKEQQLIQSKLATLRSSMIWLDKLTFFGKEIAPLFTEVKNKPTKAGLDGLNRFLSRVKLAPIAFTVEQSGRRVHPWGQQNLLRISPEKAPAKLLQSRILEVVGYRGIKRQYGRSMSRELKQELGRLLGYTPADNHTYSVSIKVQDSKQKISIYEDIGMNVPFGTREYTVVKQIPGTPATLELALTHLFD